MTFDTKVLRYVRIVRRQKISVLKRFKLGAASSTLLSNEDV